MNAQDILHFILTHSEMLIGITIGLSLLTVIFILVLPSSESKQGAVDLSGIEEALKRAIEKIPQAGPGQNTSSVVREVKMSSIQDEEEVSHVNAPDAVTASHTISGSSAPAAAAGVIDPVIIEKLKNEISEREKKIKNLENELAQKVQSPKAGNDSGAAHDDALAKIQELQGKLSEYAIIEEELADISKFKDENAKMRQELEIYRSGAAATPPPAVNVDEVITAQAMPPPPTPAPKRPEEDLAVVEALTPPPSEDQVVLEFQAAVENQAVPKASLTKDVSNAIPLQAPIEAVEAVEAPVESSLESPLDGSLDTSKMLQEIEKLGDEESVGEDDPMAGLLDTEKLLAEVRELGGPKSASVNSEQAAVDDLMSEFEAEQQQIKAKA